MKTITLEIDAEDYLCSNCGNIIWDNYCVAFKTALAKNVTSDNIRCQRCLNAEKPEHKINADLHGQEF